MSEIERAEAEVKRARDALEAAQKAADAMLVAPKVALHEAESELLVALIAASSIKVGDVIERVRRHGKTERIQITGFRHSYGRNIYPRGRVIKKNGEPGDRVTEFYGDDYRKVAPAALRRATPSNTGD